MLSMETSMVWHSGIPSMPQRCINLASLLSPIPAISPLSTSGGDFFDAISITTFPAPHVDGGEPLLLPPLLSASHAHALSLSPSSPGLRHQPSFQAVLMVACARIVRHDLQTGLSMKELGKRDHRTDRRVGTGAIRRMRESAKTPAGNQGEGGE